MMWMQTKDSTAKSIHMPKGYGVIVLNWRFTVTKSANRGNPTVTIYSFVYITYFYISYSSMQRRGQIADHNDLPNSNFSTDNFATPLRSSALSARSPPAGSSEKTVSNTTTPSLSSQEIVISENPPKSS